MAAISCCPLSLVTTLVFLYDRMFRLSVTRYGEKTNLAATELVKSLNQGLGGFKEIRILGGEKTFHQKVRNAAKKLAFYQKVHFLLCDDTLTFGLQLVAHKPLLFRV